MVVERRRAVGGGRISHPEGFNSKGGNSRLSTNFLLHQGTSCEETVQVAARGTHMGSTANDLELPVLFTLALA